MSWLGKLLGRKTLTPEEWMNRARIAIQCVVSFDSYINTPCIRMVADRKEIVLFAYVYGDAKCEHLFRFKLSSSPEHAIKTKVGPWIKKNTTAQPI